MDSNQDDFCGTFYAAKTLGLSVGTVQALVEKNELQAWKTQGGHRRISMQSIREYQRLHGISEVPMKASHLKVLVVDDDDATLEVFREKINRWNFPVDCTTMSSAMEAMIDITSIKPDVLVTDLKMPGVDGFELLRTLRANPAFSSMVLLAMTGLSEEEIAKKGGLPSLTYTVQKPIDMKWLHGFLTALVALRQLSAG